eukprot:1159670-Pelagomonas_calceolata.AAC.8
MAFTPLVPVCMTCTYNHPSLAWKVQTFTPAQCHECVSIKSGDCGRDITSINLICHDTNTQTCPQQGRLGQWEAAKREEASAAVQRGLRNWSELQASLSKGHKAKVFQSVPTLNQKMQILRAWIALLSPLLNMAKMGYGMTADIRRNNYFGACGNGLDCEK